MASIVAKGGALTVRAHIGDAKTLLAFDMPKAQTKNLAGFTIFCQPPGQSGFYLSNTLRFENPALHAQDKSLPPTSSFNAPFRKFRWLHIPGSIHQGIDPPYGLYTYTVTPRYLDAKGHMLPIDKTKSVPVKVTVQPFAKGALTLGFTRGFTQSEAFVHHFSKDAPLVPANRQFPDVSTLVFDTTEVAGTNAHGEAFTYRDEYDWMGYTARERIFELLDKVLADTTLHLDVFAYDLNEPDLIDRLLKLAKQGRIRVILDNSADHTTKPGQMVKGKPKPPTWEDKFALAFAAAKSGQAALLRGHFKRYSHDKIFILSKGGTAQSVMTGSTNFSVTGLYVNSNHVLIFNDPGMAGTYQQLFNQVWTDGVSETKFLASSFSPQRFEFTPDGISKLEITFAPHAQAFALELLQDVSDRIEAEAKHKHGSVLFAVMQIDGSDSTVYKTLANLHKNKKIFSYGITDTAKGIALYKPGLKQGVLVTGKPVSTVLPAPFDQVPNIEGFGHQVHHKFVVCGFNGSDPVVICGSSNLASGGEQENGDNLLTIHDGDVATAFAIEAVALVDHFNFLDKYATKKQKAGEGTKTSAQTAKKPASKIQAAAAAGWFLDTNDRWVASYFDPNDMHCADRVLFG